MCASDNCVGERCVQPLDKKRKIDPVWEEKRIQMEKIQSLECRNKRDTEQCGGCGADSECKESGCRSGYCAKTKKDYLICAYQFKNVSKKKLLMSDRNVSPAHEVHFDGYNRLKYFMKKFKRIMNRRNSHEVNRNQMRYGREHDKNERSDSDKKQFGLTEHDLTVAGLSGVTSEDDATEYTVEGASCPRIGKDDNIPRKTKHDSNS